MRLLRHLLTIAVVFTIGCLALVMAASEFGGEVVTLRTHAERGDKSTHLWIVDDAGFAWLRAGKPGSGWLARIDKDPNVVIERGGRAIHFRATPMRQPQTRDRIHLLMREKYGLADRLVSVGRDPAQSVPVRLEPVAPSVPKSSQA